MNDKHSATPSMYKCQYSPCPYESKRESNCKQHMEKAHGWQYIRSKNNGKGGKKPQTGRTPPTPQTPQMSTPGSYVFDAPSPTFQEAPTFYGASTNQSVASGPLELSGQYGSDSTMGTNDTFGPFDPNFSWIGSHNEYGSGDLTDYSGGSQRPSWDASMTNPSAPLSSFETSLNPQDEEPLFGDTFDWSNMEPDMTSMNIQLYTPATSIDTRPYEAFSRNPSISLDEQACGQIPSLSPGAQGDAMLYTPYSMHSNDLSVDEGYVEYHDVLKPGHDFPLFDSSNAASNPNSTSNEGMFQDLSTFPTGWSGRGTDLAQQFGIDDMMRIDE